MAIKYTNVFHCKTQFTQIEIFDLKLCHLATLVAERQGGGWVGSVTQFVSSKLAESKVQKY
jgi:hypothetical protein